MLVRLIENNYAEITDTATAGTKYFCRAKKIGASASSPVRQIWKEVTAANVVTKTRADGNDKYDNVASNRTSLTYL